MRRFVINGRLPGLNDMIATARANKFASAKEKKAFTFLCSASAKSARLEPVSDPVCVRLLWFEQNQRRDIDNIAAGVKFVLDGLVDAGVLPNDNRRYVRQLVHEFPEPDPKFPRIEVQIEPINQESP